MNAEGCDPAFFEPWLRIAGQAFHSREAVLEDGACRIERISGGGNNALYKLSMAAGDLAGDYAIKLCVADERRRAYREYQGMSLMRAAGLDLSPEPLFLDESCQQAPYPVVIYRWLAGGSPRFSAGMVEKLSHDIQALQGLHPQDWAAFELPDAIFHHFEFDFYLKEQAQLLKEYGPWLASQGKTGARLAERMENLVAACRALVRTSRVRPDIPPAQRGFCRLDYNRTNAILGPEGGLRWVDWEYAGWGDPALELADVRWHASLDDLDPALHDRLRLGYRPDKEDKTFYERLVIWDRVVLARWPLVVVRLLWSRTNGPDRPRLSQVEESPQVMWARLERMVERAEDRNNSYPINL